MMIEVMGMDMYQSEYEEVIEAADHEWFYEMDDEDRECYESIEEFEDMYLHSYLYSDD